MADSALQSLQSCHAIQHSVQPLCDVLDAMPVSLILPLKSYTIALCHKCIDQRP